MPKAGKHLRVTERKVEKRVIVKYTKTNKWNVFPYMCKE